MELAPVIIFVYNRPTHTKKMLDSLAKNAEAKETDIYIFSDAPKDDKNVAKVEEVRTIVNGFVDAGVFKNIFIFEAEKNKGLANSVIEGVDSIMSQRGKAIVLEDDLEVSKFFLKYEASL